MQREILTTSKVIEIAATHVAETMSYKAEDIMSDVLNSRVFSEDLGADSLDLSQITTALDDEFDIDFEKSLGHWVNSFDDVISVLKKANMIDDRQK